MDFLPALATWGQVPGVQVAGELRWRVLFFSFAPRSLKSGSLSASCHSWSAKEKTINRDQNVSLVLRLYRRASILRSFLELTFLDTICLLLIRLVGRPRAKASAIFLAVTCSALFLSASCSCWIFSKQLLISACWCW